MLRILFIFIFFTSSLLAIGPIPKLATYSVKTGTVGLVLLENEGITDAKLSFDKVNVDFYQHPSEKNLLYAFLPVDIMLNQKDKRSL